MTTSPAGWAFYFRLMSNLCSYSSSIAKDYVMKLSCGANYYVNLTNGKGILEREAT